MCEAFAKSGHSVDLIARRGVEKPESLFRRYGVNELFRFHAIDQRGIRGFHTALFLRDVVQTVRTLGPVDLFFARDVLALFFVASVGVPLVFEAHGTYKVGSFQERAFKRVSRFPNFKKLVAVTEPMKKEFTDRCPWLVPDQTLVLPNAADDMQATLVNIGAARPGRPGALQVGYVGHLYQGRGAEIVLAAAHRFPELDFHFVGGTPDDITRLTATGVPQNVVFHGFCTYDQIPAIYGWFDILTAPYQEQVYTAGGAETSAVMCPLKLYEYLSAGKPIISSDLPAIRTVIEHERQALLVPPSDIEAFSAALRRLSQDGALRDRLGRNARMRFVEQGSWTTRVEKLLNSFQEANQSPQCRAS
jgi:glycosyltransferase involved in cell wall biosynthesis